MLFRSGFDLVERILTEATARSEAKRCLQCTSHCDKCVEVCPNRANVTYAALPTSFASLSDFSIDFWGGRGVRDS